MKKVIIILTFILLTEKANSQSDAPNVIKLSLPDLIFSTLTLKYERALHDRLSFEISGSYTYKKITLWDELTGRFKGPSAGIQMRYYFPPLNSNTTGTEAPEGLYSSVWSKWDTYSMDMTLGQNKVNLLNGHSISGGINIGYQFWLKEILFLDIYAGGGFIYSNYTGRFAPKGKLLIFDKSGFVPKLGVTLGYPF